MAPNKIRDVLYDTNVYSEENVARFGAYLRKKKYVLKTMQLLRLEIIMVVKLVVDDINRR